MSSPPSVAPTTLRGDTGVSADRGEIDAPAIEEFASGRDSYEHRRVTVFGDADGRLMLYLLLRHVLLL
jgi:hypothetical protein